MKAMFSVLITFAVLMSKAVAADSNNSANTYLTACKEFSNRVHPAENMFDQGMCLGQIMGLAYWAYLLPSNVVEGSTVGPTCLPQGVTGYQMVAVVVQWLDQRPRMLE
jgi:hypothetical protein